MRRTAALALVACGAALIISPALAGAETPPATGESNIAIEQTVSPEQGQCLPALLALTNVVGQTETTFSLRVIVSAPLCEPITATAVIYAMPGNGVAWPQELVETKDVVISEAGEILVTFTKTCDPVQFDVVVGATPQTIDPFTAPFTFHGPLLFPVDTGTALQYFGCTSPTTTTSDTTTTTSSTTTSSTIPVSVLGSTTIAPAIAAVTSSTTSTPGVAVAGTSATNRNANASALALTGSTSGWFVGLGLALLTVGGLLFLGTRRRPAHVDVPGPDPTLD